MGYSVAGQGNKSTVVGKILCVCSFDTDEPYHEIFRAADLLPSELHLYITGNFSKVGILPENFPSITFLGFVPEHEYYWHMFSFLQSWFST